MNYKFPPEIQELITREEKSRIDTKAREGEMLSPAPIRFLGKIFPVLARLGSFFKGEPLQEEEGNDDGWHPRS
jgi:hypothetical protein